MHINCPHCQNPIEVVEEPQPNEVVCPSCGSSFQLDPGRTATFFPTAGPRRVGKFEFLEELGVGAFGTVYKARDTELDRLVAIKVPRPVSAWGHSYSDRLCRRQDSQEVDCSLFRRAGAYILNAGTCK